MDKELEAGTISGAEARQDSFPPLDEHKQAAVHMTPDSDENTDRVDETAQAGVQAIEATTVVWSKRSLIVAYVMIWLIYFVDSLQQGATIQLGPYVTSSFYQHSLTAATGIMSNIIGGVSKLTIAKILDIWGRPQGYAISIVILTLGLIMMAACNGVELYAAAQVFYWVGYNGIGYTLSIFVADTSQLKNRSLMFALASSPYIITTWTSSPIASSILSGPGWRWGFGIFCIVTPAVTTPLLALFMVNLRKARARGLIPAEKAKSGRTTLESIKYYFVEFDAIGLLLVSAGLSLFLLSFSLYSLQPNQWRSPLVISFIVIGGLLMAAFVVWEKWFAPVKFLPYHLLTDRTVLGACVLSAVLFVSFYIWDSYFLSFLQVVNGLSVTHAGYVFNTYSIGSCLWALVVGVVIRWTGRFKPLALYFGMPLTILGVALMIHFRQPDVNIGYIVMCQIFIAFAGGTLVICEQTAAMAAVSHQYVAVVLALEGMFAYVGGAIGQTVASAIWTGVFPKKLEQYLPESAQQNLTQIYGSLVVQLSYPRGTPERDAIILAYGDAQRNMLIASSAVLVIGVVAVFFWRDINVKERKQVKGLVI